MPASTDPAAWALHPRAVRRDAVDFVANVALEDDPDSPLRYEQLLFERLPDERYRLCCIPFFHYGLALGDVVTLVRRDDVGWTPDRVVERGGSWTLRALVSDDEAGASLGRLLEQRGLPSESVGRLVAFSVQGQAALRDVRSDLDEMERTVGLAYETGWLGQG